MSDTKKRSKSYYLTPVKFIRDLVHKYVNLTEFELEIIDTLRFQRLKDIRQLTCQHVFQTANHTRFEHSLGVLELTRRAIRHLKENGIIASEETPDITDKLAFNACLAALLHDVGHCPFSHLGENEFDENEVWKKLSVSISGKPQLKDLYDDLYDKKGKKENIGSVHEQMSCIVIIEHYYDQLKKLDEKAKENDKDDECEIETDFELLIRSILGIEYDISTKKKFDTNKTKNVIVRLINSNIFDMDKLDYIMRDSFFTGIGTPAIDTQRLFKNMFLNNKMEIVFKNKAISVLQHMIDSRDELYMYVINHHAVVYSDFMNTYISRKLVHNAEYLEDNILSIVKDNESKNKLKKELMKLPILKLANEFRHDIFHPDAILDNICSDSDWISLLNFIYKEYNLKKDKYQKGKCIDIMRKSGISRKDVKKMFGTIKARLKYMVDLITKYKKRDFLKPWWKTIFEFNSFIRHHFRDDSVYRDVCKFICTGGKHLDAAEFRSQIAKHVTYIANTLKEKGNEDLITPFGHGDFFVIQRATNFFDQDTIEKLEIYFRDSGIIGAPCDVNDKAEKYYAKTLTKVIPQKDYESIYAKEGFYIFSKRISEQLSGNNSSEQQQKRKRHYELIEQIFVFVSTELVKRGEQDFVERFPCEKGEGEDIQDFKKRIMGEETKSKEKMFDLFTKNHPEFWYNKSLKDTPKCEPSQKSRQSRMKRWKKEQRNILRKQKQQIYKFILKKKYKKIGIIPSRIPNHKL